MPPRQSSSISRFTTSSFQVRSASTPPTGIYLHTGRPYPLHSRFLESLGSKRPLQTVQLNPRALSSPPPIDQSIQPVRSRSSLDRSVHAHGLKPDAFVSHIKTTRLPKRRAKNNPENALSSPQHGVIPRPSTYSNTWASLCPDRPPHLNSAGQQSRQPAAGRSCRPWLTRPCHCYRCRERSARCETME
jgi:hypothetical protein